MHWDLVIVHRTAGMVHGPQNFKTPADSPPMTCLVPWEKGVLGMNRLGSLERKPQGISPGPFLHSLLRARKSQSSLGYSKVYPGWSSASTSGLYGCAYLELVPPKCRNSFPVGVSMEDNKTETYPFAQKWHKPSLCGLPRGGNEVQDVLAT